MDRRESLKLIAGVCALASGALGASRAVAQAVAPAGPFKLAPLGYCLLYTSPSPRD